MRLYHCGILGNSELLRFFAHKGLWLVSISWESLSNESQKILRIFLSVLTDNCPLQVNIKFNGTGVIICILGRTKQFDWETIHLRKYMQYTDRCHYKTVQYDVILHTTLQWNEAELKSEFKFTKSLCPRGQAMGFLLWRFWRTLAKF